MSPLRIHALNKIALGLILSAFVSLCFSATDDDISVDWRKAARAAGMPTTVLYGIAMVETGRVWSDGVKRPWPWTLHLNSPDRAMRFWTRADAERTLRWLLSNGYDNVDVGTMQVNVRYHRSRVSDPVDLLDPAVNLAVSAQILHENKLSTAGDNARAVGSYNAGLHPSRAARAKWYENLVADEVRKILPPKQAGKS